MKKSILLASALLLFSSAQSAFALAPGIEGCTPAYGEFSNTTPVAIADNTTQTSTIAVSGQTGTISDLDLQTFITHTFPGDLDITLTSPAGTSVTVTTDNAGTNDDVFNGTYWDDQADPFGAIPFPTSTNLVTHHTYAVSVLASPLVPEEGFGAFKGESANGTWTLTVVDDSGGDTGSLASWKLRIATCTTTPAKKVTSFSNTNPFAITDNNPALAVTSTIAVSGLKTSICGVRVTPNVTHTFSADIEMTLTSPSGIVATVIDDNGGSNDNVFAGTLFEGIADLDSVVPYAGIPNIVSDFTYTDTVLATPLTPLESLATFDGENPNGTWTLTVDDDAAGDTGTLNSWTLEITTCAPDADADGVADADDSCTGADTDTNANGIADCLESDLKPVNLTAKRIGNKMKCSFKIQNAGVVSAAASKAEIRFGVASDSTGKVKKTVDVPALAAGAKSSKFTVTKNRGTARYCRFVADSGAGLTETNETNNSKSKLAS